MVQTPGHGSDQGNIYSSNDDQGRVYQNGQFHERGSCAGAWLHKSYSVNALFLVKSSSVLLSIDQTNRVYSKDNSGRVYQNGKFHNAK